MMTRSILFLVLFTIQTSFACTGFFQGIDLTYPRLKSYKADKQLEARFEKYTTEFHQLTKSLIDPGKSLKINLTWDESRFDATATRDMQDNPIINVNGGLLRHPTMDRNSYFLILCHELGHFYGGAPRKFRGQSSLRSWSSVEGQADYYATSKCMRAILKTDRKQDQISKASLNVAKLFSEAQSYSRPVGLSNHDEYVTWETIQNHPSPQCRLDTFMAGLKCPVEEYIGFDPVDPKVGSCFREQTQEQELNPLARPLCWYSPLMF